MLEIYTSQFESILERIKQDPARYNDRGIIDEYFNNSLDSVLRDFSRDHERGIYEGTSAEDLYQAEHNFEEACDIYKGYAHSFITEYRENPEVYFG